MCISDICSELGSPQEVLNSDSDPAVHITSNDVGNGDIETILGAGSWISSPDSGLVELTVTPTEPFILSSMQLTLSGEVIDIEVSIDFTGITQPATTVNNTFFYNQQIIL